MLPTFITKGNAKFQLEVDTNDVLHFAYLCWVAGYLPYLSES